MAYHNAAYFLGFLPAALLFYLAARRALPGAATWLLLAASILYYLLADPSHLALIAAATALTWAAGRSLHAAPDGRGRTRLFAAALLGNLALLAAWKLDLPGLGAGFLASETVLLTQGMLPLGLSYLTLQQVTFLFAMRDRTARPLPFGSYALYVFFFPHIMLGPILRYEDAEEQYAGLARRRIAAATIVCGFSLFVVGLAKKLLVGDRLAALADPLFNGAAAGAALGFWEAWLAAWSYALQLYFDFSGYSDMAIGGALMFGLRMPINFFSPFKARTASELFDRWHMSLVAFVRVYLFSPLYRLVRPRLPGRAATRSTIAWAAATIVSLTLVGWWHGSKATLVVSGFLVGVLTVLYSLLAARLGRRAGGPRPPGWAARIFFRALLPLGLMVFGIFFRAEDLGTVGALLGAMANPFAGTGMSAAGASALSSGLELVILAAATVIVFAAPNTCQLFGLWDHPGAPARPPADAEERLLWRPTLPWAAGLGVAAAAALVFSFAGRESASIYAAF